MTYVDLKLQDLPIPRTFVAQRNGELITLRVFSGDDSDVIIIQMSTDQADFIQAELHDKVWGAESQEYNT